MFCMIIWDFIIKMNFIKVLYCHLVSEHLPHVFSINSEISFWDFWSISLLTSGERALDSIQASKLGSKILSYHLNATSESIIDIVLP